MHQDLFLFNIHHHPPQKKNFTIQSILLSYHHSCSLNTFDVSRVTMIQENKSEVQFAKSNNTEELI